MLKQLYFVRHGQTEWNAIRRMQGHQNSDLSDLGKQQADVNGKLLSDFNIQTLYVSPLGRTRQTAEIINNHLNLTPFFDERIKEWDCGDWSGHHYDDVTSNWAEEWQALMSDRFNYRGPNCENFPDMRGRVIPFLEELQVQDEQNITIISHGMIGRVMMSYLLEFDEQQSVSFQQPNDVVFRVTLDEDAKELCHFIGGDGPYPGAT